MVLLLHEMVSLLARDLGTHPQHAVDAALLVPAVARLARARRPRAVHVSALALHLASLARRRRRCGDGGW